MTSSRLKWVAVFRGDDPTLLRVPKRAESRLRSLWQAIGGTANWVSLYLPSKASRLPWQEARPGTFIGMAQLPDYDESMFKVVERDFPYAHSYSALDVACPIDKFEKISGPDLSIFRLSVGEYEWRSLLGHLHSGFPLDLATSPIGPSVEQFIIGHATAVAARLLSHLISAEQAFDEIVEAVRTAEIHWLAEELKGIRADSSEERLTRALDLLNSWAGAFEALWHADELLRSNEPQLHRLGPVLMCAGAQESPFMSDNLKKAAERLLPFRAAIGALKRSIGT